MNIKAWQFPPRPSDEAEASMCKLYQGPFDGLVLLLEDAQDKMEVMVKFTEDTYLTHVVYKRDEFDENTFVWAFNKHTGKLVK